MKPSGTVSSISVVVAPSSSVGTESVNCCSTFDLATGGLMIACAEATLASTSVSAAAPAAARANLIGLLSFAGRGQAASGGPRERMQHRDEQRRERRDRSKAGEALWARAGGDGARGRRPAPRRAGGRPPRRARRRRAPARRAAGSRSGAPADQAGEAVEADPRRASAGTTRTSRTRRSWRGRGRPRATRAGAGAAAARPARAASAARSRTPSAASQTTSTDPSTATPSETSVTTTRLGPPASARAPRASGLGASA